uniref:Uncharacterized protein n=1 Tax=viral metagenome TaxID=1070528 RepID=A0A6C0B095_9ZZZZ
MVFILLFFSFYFYRTVKINKAILYCNNKHGYDDRHNHTEIDTFNKERFAALLYKKSLLNLLETSSIGINKKLLLIEKYNLFHSNETSISIKKIDIKAGGLLTDWEKQIL